MYDSQYGFREHHSTKHAVYELVDRITNKLEIKEVPLIIFMDMTKAFDTLGHEILLRKMAYNGILGPAQLWVHSYLTNKKQYNFLNFT